MSCDHCECQTKPNTIQEANEFMALLRKLAIKYPGKTLDEIEDIIKEEQNNEQSYGASTRTNII
jgi:hypothetical protein